ncbi:MAG: Gfo/Idh/MocA family oxidoreductase [Thermomicrobiales bacterium]
MSDRRRYRAGVIGTGKISRGHGHAYVTNPDVDLVAVSDIAEGAREGFATEFGVPRTYADAAEMLAAEHLDIVSVCTWPPLHRELTEAAFAAGVKGVWCEKPMAVHLEEATAMVDAATKAGGVLVINHQRRYMAAYNQAIDLIAQGVIGTVTQINGICGGDALTDGTHLIDMTRYLNGDNPVTTVFGAIEMSPMGDIDPNGMGTLEFNKTRKRYGHHVESGSLAILFFENGVRGHLEMGNLARPGYQRFIIEGTDGRIELSGDSAFEDGTRIRVRVNSGEAPSVPASDLGGAMEAALARMLESIETGVDHPMSGASGRNDLEIVNAIYESSRRRLKVSLPLDVQTSPLEAMLVSGEIQIN